MASAEQGETFDPDDDDSAWTTSPLNAPTLDRILTLAIEIPREAKALKKKQQIKAAAMRRRAKAARDAKERQLAAAEAKKQENEQQAAMKAIEEAAAARQTAAAAAAAAAAELQRAQLDANAAATPSPRPAATPVHATAQQAQGGHAHGLSDVPDMNEQEGADFNDSVMPTAEPPVDTWRRPLLPTRHDRQIESNVRSPRFSPSGSDCFSPSHLGPTFFGPLPPSAAPAHGESGLNRAFKQHQPASVQLSALPSTPTPSHQPSSSTTCGGALPAAAQPSPPTPDSSAASVQAAFASLFPPPDSSSAPLPAAVPPAAAAAAHNQQQLFAQMQNPTYPCAFALPYAPGAIGMPPGAFPGFQPLMHSGTSPEIAAIQAMHYAQQQQLARQQQLAQQQQHFAQQQMQHMQQITAAWFVNNPHNVLTAGLSPGNMFMPNHATASYAMPFPTPLPIRQQCDASHNTTPPDVVGKQQTLAGLIAAQGFDPTSTRAALIAELRFEIQHATSASRQI
eukprot:6189442-Pleurochrysis_carterae.AAC.1